MRTQILFLCILLSSQLLSCSDDPSSPHETATDVGADTLADVESGDVATVPSNPYEGYVSEQYGSGANWLCHPLAEENICERPLHTTIVHTDGTAELEEHVAAVDPPVDCFYVYPTLSVDVAPNSDLEPGDEEVFAVLNQAARLNSVCRVYAPVYRQVTIAALFNSSIEMDWELAYDDVENAWKHYIANDNQGRGIILVGHSQGSSHLRRVIQDEIEGVPELEELLVAAYLIGMTMEVPLDADIGGSFQSTPLCRDPAQIGCVVTYASFRDTEPPPSNTHFGGTSNENTIAGCNNPAALAGGSAVLSSYFPTSVPAALEFVIGGVASPYAEPDDHPEVTTPFFAVPGLVSGECVVRDGLSYFAVTVLPDPDDPRVDDISGDFTPEWGLHLVDVNLAMGDLVTLARSQVEVYLAGVE